MSTNQILRIDGMQAAGQSVAHLALVVPQPDERGNWPTDADHRYLCDRVARDVHNMTFPWSERDEFPTCSRCRRVAKDMLAKGEAQNYGRQLVVIREVQNDA